MYFVFFILWVIFNGNVTLEIVLFGLAIAAVMYAFICRFMDFSIRKDIRIMKISFYILQYIAILVVEIVKANFIAMRLLLSARYEIEPVLVKFRTTLKSKTARVVLANSITLTPGTITVSLEEDELVVHCLDKDLALGIEDSIFSRALEKLEKVD